MASNAENVPIRWRHNVMLMHFMAGVAQMRLRINRLQSCIVIQMCYKICCRSTVTQVSIISKLRDCWQNFHTLWQRCYLDNWSCDLSMGQITVLCYLNYNIKIFYEILVPNPHSDSKTDLIPSPHVRCARRTHILDTLAVEFCVFGYYHPVSGWVTAFRDPGPMWSW